MSTTTRPWPGVRDAVSFARREGYVPMEWAGTIERESIALITAVCPRYPEVANIGFRPRITLAGIPLGCSYCHRPVGDRVTCDGCGAPLDL